MDRRLLSDSGKVQTWLFAGDHGEFVSSSRQWFGDILDANAENREYGTVPRYKEGVGELVARIPVVIWGRLRELGIAKDPQLLREWLDNDENAVFRTNTMPLTRRAMERKYGR